MRISKCDICKKVIQEYQKVDFLLNKKFIKKEDISKFKTKAL